MPRWSLDWKGCMKIFHLGSTQRVWIHSQGWGGQNRSEEGRCSAPPADSLLTVSGESLSNLRLRGGEMLVQKPLVLGGEVNQSCYCWADFVTGTREEGGEVMRVWCVDGTGGIHQKDACSQRAQMSLERMPFWGSPLRKRMQGFPGSPVVKKICSAMQGT